MVSIRTNFVFLVYRIHWEVMNRWNGLSEELKENGLMYDHSQWLFSIDGMGRAVIFNQCALPAEVFRIFNSEFFGAISKSFDADWEKVTRYSFEYEWEPYVSSTKSIRPNPKQVGWISKKLAFGEDTEKEYSDSSPPEPFFKKIMD